MARYVVVDPEERVIVGGPYLWDGVSAWVPPEPGVLMVEAEAAAEGFVYPPDPASE